jgi:hypothetical protein
MDDSRILRGIELRYVLTMYLAQHGPCSIATLIDGLSYQGFVIAGNPPKSVSDALRWEMAHCRVCRRGRGIYAPFEMPRSTEYRIHQLVTALRAQVDRIRAEAGTSHSGSAPRQSRATSMSDNSTRTPPVDNRPNASKNAPASGVVTARQAAS